MRRAAREIGLWIGGSAMALAGAAAVVVATGAIVFLVVRLLTALLG